MSAGFEPTASQPRLRRFMPLPAADFRDRFRVRLRDRRFWGIQAMVIAVTIVHAAAELIEHRWGSHLDAAYFIPVSLYLFPVLYASLNFGSEGAMPTALWSALLAVPNIILWHEGLERAGEVFQLSVMLLLAFLVATRVDRETLARRHAVAIEQQRRVSELKYRALFDAAGEACLVVDGNGCIRDANAAAAALLGRATDGLVGAALPDIVDLDVPTVRHLARSGALQTLQFRLKTGERGDLWIRPICTAVSADDGSDELLQVLLQDVTEQRRIERYAHEIVRALEDERRRIAQEIHDVSVQSLVLLCRRLDAISASTEAELPAPTVAAIAEARRSAEEVANELRRFSRDLRPVVLDDLGLTPAIRRLVAELGERTAIRTSFSAVGLPRRLTGDGELSLFRIVQEALRNVELHAEASHVAVRLTYAPDEVRLVVSDDGKGFDTAAYALRSSDSRLGLLGMHERARLAGGTCHVESRPGGGTRVLACVPMAVAAANR
ncbi:MAG: hypothetical protein Kow0010_16670 [Dehalococcoidia bacterium]